MDFERTEDFFLEDMDSLYNVIFCYYHLITVTRLILFHPLLHPDGQEEAVFPCRKNNDCSVLSMHSKQWQWSNVKRINPIKCILFPLTISLHCFQKMFQWNFHSQVMIMAINTWPIMQILPTQNVGNILNRVLLNCFVFSVLWVTELWIIIDR